jgi:cysteine desulfuration protein SufE
LPLALARSIPFCMSKFDDIAADFEFLEEWDDRYKYIIDLGRALDAYPEAFRNDAHKVRGCASQVWLHADKDGNVINFAGDSDAHIVKGLVALLLALYSGKTPAQILEINPEAALAPFDLKDHLTPQRSNGLASMVNRIRAIAEATNQKK